jgi:hypothetical protein
MKDIPYNVCCNLPSHLCSCTFIQSDEFFTVLRHYTFWMLVIWIYNKFFKMTRMQFCKYVFNNKVELTRRRMHKLGERVKRDIGYPAVLASALTILVGAYGSYKFYASIMKVQSDSHNMKDSMREPKPDRERENPWYKDDYQITEIDLSRETTSWKHYNESEIIDRLQYNCIRLIIKTQIDEQTIVINQNNAIGLGGHWYMSNNHAFKDQNEFNIEVIRGAQSNGVSNNMNLFIHSQELHRFPELDLVIFQIRNLPPVKTIIGLFNRDSFNARGNCVLVTRSKQGEIINKRIHRVEQKSICMKNLPNQPVMKIWEGTMLDKTIF